MNTKRTITTQKRTVYMPDDEGKTSQQQIPNPYAYPTPSKTAQDGSQTIEFRNKSGNAQVKFTGELEKLMSYYDEMKDLQDDVEANITYMNEFFRTIAIRLHESDEQLSMSTLVLTTTKLKSVLGVTVSTFDRFHGGKYYSKMNMSYQDAEKEVAAKIASARVKINNANKELRIAEGYATDIGLYMTETAKLLGETELVNKINNSIKTGNRDTKFNVFKQSNTPSVRKTGERVIGQNSQSTHPTTEATTKLSFRHTVTAYINAMKKTIESLSAIVKEIVDALSGSKSPELVAAGLTLSNEHDAILETYMTYFKK